MSSPFPGVDPYIEAQYFWQDFHQSFMTYWRDQILAVLPDHYDARLEERVHQVAVSNGSDGNPRYPDITVSRSGPSKRRPRSENGGTLLLEPVAIALPEYEEMREAYIRVTHRPDRKLVAVLELLSPTNKTSLGSGEYESKRKELLSQEVHLVEVDLLIEGQRLPMRSDLPPGDYYAIISRSERRPKADVFAWTIRDRLPSIPIPLRRPDPDIHVDLGQVFTTTYDRGRYRLALEYSRPLNLSLSPQDRRWAHQQSKPRKK